MPTKAVIEIIQFGLFICSKILPFIPIKIIETNSGFIVSKREINNNIQKLWEFVLFISFAITFVDVYYSSYHSKPINLVTLFYHVFLLLSKMAGAITIYVFQTNIKEIMFLLKCICTRSNTNLTFKARPRLKTNNVLFSILLSVVTLTLIIVYALILPIIIVSFPCFHDCVIEYFSLKIYCVSILFRILMLIIHGPFMVTTGIEAYIVSAVCLVTLKEIATDLRCLR